MSGPIGRYAYVSDDGNTYSIRMDVTNAVAVGNTSDATSPDLPRTYRCRYILARDASDGSERKIVVGDATSAVWLGPGLSSISISDYDTDPNTTTQHSVRTRIGEKRFAR